MKKIISPLLILVLLAGCTPKKIKYSDLVNPFLGTAPLTDSAEIGYKPPKNWRVWAGLVFPGSSVPNAMVQLSPITQFRSGAGYEYEDTIIQAFTHTNKGHWNLCHIPLLPIEGDPDTVSFYSPFDHKNESAAPGYYQVYLKKYDINAELTSTLRCGYHKYTYTKGGNKKLIANLGISNERVNEWNIQQEGKNAFAGFQQTGDKIYFYAETNQEITGIDSLIRKWRNREFFIPYINFKDSNKPLEIKIALSFVSVENARKNLETEIADWNFDQISTAANNEWNTALSKYSVEGGTDEQKTIFYTAFYHTMIQPSLYSDIDGSYRGRDGKVH